MKARSWQDIEELYYGLNNLGWEHDKLLELVKSIQAAGLSNRVFAATSLDKLIISNNCQIDYEKDCLHIEFDRQSQKWLFKYFGGQSYNQQQPEFERAYEPTEGIEKFLNFVKMINW